MGLFSFLGNVISKGASIGSKLSRKVGGLQGAQKKFGTIVNAGRQFGSIANKLSDNKLSQSQLGQKIMSANEKVESFKKNVDSVMPELKMAVENLKTG